MQVRYTQKFFSEMIQKRDTSMYPSFAQKRLQKAILFRIKKFFDLVPIK